MGEIDPVDPNAGVREWFGRRAEQWQEGVIEQLWGLQQYPYS